MRILCVIDSFGGGGAQRQIATLACELKRRGHDIEFFIYHPEHGFFRSKVVEAGIPIHEYSKGKGFSFGVIKALRRLLRSGHYNVVLSYQDIPNIYSEISKLFFKSPTLVVSERNSHLNDNSKFIALVMRHGHRLANHIIVNSASHKEWLENNHRWLKGKVTTIYNGVDIGAYFYEPNIPNDKHGLQLLAIGRIVYQKNVLTLVQALAIFYRQHGWIPTLSWVGRRDTSPSDKQYCSQVDDLLKHMPEVNRHWQWLGERTDVAQLLKEHHALIHPSFYEGFPNVVCEALTAGRPVLASNVCDNGRLVEEGVRGFLFDPQEPESISEAIYRLASLTNERFGTISEACRDFAIETLSIDRMASEYQALFNRIMDPEKR